MDQVVSNPPQQQQQSTTENPSETPEKLTNSTQAQETPVKSSATKQQRRQKRKKVQALKSFLNDNKKSEQLLQLSTPKRPKASSDNETEEVILEEVDHCKVCGKNIIQKKKNCGFCHALACNDHMRKKRKHPKSGKFVRVCDDCEDKHLYEKYMKLEMKAEESLHLQELITASKHQELTDIIAGKMTKMKVLMSKKEKIQEDRSNQEGRLLLNEGEIRNKERKLESKEIQLENLERHLAELEKTMAPSLEDDFRELSLENEKINKQLVKNQKKCQEALQAKLKKEKQMYEEYYRWEDTQRQKQIEASEKKDDCNIY